MRRACSARTPGGFFGGASPIVCSRNIMTRSVTVISHASAYVYTTYVSLRQHTAAYGSIRQHTAADVSIRQQTSANVNIRQHTAAYVSIRQHKSAYVSIRQQATPAATTCDLTPRAAVFEAICIFTGRVSERRAYFDGNRNRPPTRGGLLACDAVCQHASAYVSIRQHTSAYVSIRQELHAAAF
jgi:hypothetical protein